MQLRYKAKAPSKGEVFSSGRAGETIKIGCWIGRSVYCCAKVSNANS